MRMAIPTVQIIPRKLPNKKLFLSVGFESKIYIVFFSISPTTASADRKIAIRELKIEITASPTSLIIFISSVKVKRLNKMDKKMSIIAKRKKTKKTLLLKDLQKDF